MSSPAQLWPGFTLADTDETDLLRMSLRESLHGVEREALRVTPCGNLALSPHSPRISDPLACDCITTDFSESQLELITPPLQSITQVVEHLHKLHVYVQHQLGHELIWPASMPARLPLEKHIPIARYGDSPQARHKEIYRRGLALRYGKKIQMVSGIHYNFSFSHEFLEILACRLRRTDESHQEFIDRLYMALARNFLRLRWLVVYLFGASPVVDASYTLKAIESMQMIDAQTYAPPHATSLRMSRFGYANSEKIQLDISYNSLQQYCTDLRHAMATHHEPYVELERQAVERPAQLNANVLQIENEYYSPVRVKQAPRSGESSLDALENRGIAYIEMRASDLSPYVAEGVSRERLYFMEALLLNCILCPSPAFEETEFSEIDFNQNAVALEGRRPGLQLLCCRQRRPLSEWATSALADIMRVATVLDELHGHDQHQSAVRKQMRKVDQTSLLPSQRMLDEMQNRQQSFVESMVDHAHTHSQNLAHEALTPEILELLQKCHCFKKHA